MTRIMNKNIILTTCLTVATALPVLATPQEVSATIESAVTRAVAQQQVLESPLEAFQRKIQAIKNPEKEKPALIELLQGLTAYNQIFETEKDLQVGRELAARLEGPIAVPWNTYRGNGLKEIFDNYVPNAHGNKALAKLEYYVKFHTVPQRTFDRTYILSKTLPADVVKAYNVLKQELASQTNRDDKKVLQSIARFVPAYNTLAESEPVLAKELKYTLLEMPIQTGWDRTFSIKDLAFQIGLDDSYSEGHTVLSVEQLHQKVHANAADEALFVPFVEALNKYDHAI